MPYGAYSASHYCYRFLSLQTHYSHPEILFSHLIEKKFSPHEKYSALYAVLFIFSQVCRTVTAAQFPDSFADRHSGHENTPPGSQDGTATCPHKGNGCGTEKGRLTGWRAVKGERKSRKKCRGGRTTEVSAHPPVSPAKQERGTSASVWDSTPPLRARKRLGGANAIPTDAVDYGRKRWATV